MSGIITAPAFAAVLQETKGNSTMQGFVTAIFEIGKLGPYKQISELVSKLS